MNNEIERKFLIRGPYEGEVKSVSNIVQGYLSLGPNCIVRVRISNDTGYITIKGPSSNQNTTRREWEKEIPAAEAEQLLDFCTGSLVEKVRYCIEYSKKVFEVDVFKGKNEGLCVAEIELVSPDESFEKPIWIGEEVTSDRRYSNAYLSLHPYCEW